MDEGRPETLYELEIAFAEIARLADDPGSEHRPWVVDRALRHLLTDITGNTHRSEFCVDKLYNPDALRGRLGLLELRGFEMAPHPDMALVQALLVRALVARFAEQPYSAPLVRWGTALHERFLLPHFAMADLADVVADLRAHDLDLDLAWFDVFTEFRFPLVGVTTVGGVGLELRTAIEPWYVLGEEASVRGDGALCRLLDRAAAGPGDRLRAGPAPAGLQRPTGAADRDRHAGGVRRRACATGPGGRGRRCIPPWRSTRRSAST